jgi:hypothetical protein
MCPQNLEMIDEMKSSNAETHEHAPANVDEVNDTLPQRETLFRRMSPYHGVFSPVPLWKMIVTPFLIVVNPAVIWACLTIAFPVLWLIGISLVVAQIFSAPPYLLTPAQVGYLNAGPVVLGSISSIIAGVTSDWSAKWFSRRNHGTYEPEFRLFGIIGLVTCAGLGYFLFGYLVQIRASVVSISVMYGITLCGAQFATVCVGTYMVDAYRGLSVDVFITTMVFKNFLFYGFTSKPSKLHRLCLSDH